MNDLTQQLHEMIVIRRNPDLPGIYDIEFRHLGRIRGYDLLECHLVLYPYSRQLNSGKIILTPYEEYARDILAQQRSAYKPIGQIGKNLFGIFLGALIIGIFALLKPVELYSIESIVSIIGAYAIGKELWDDLENWLVNLTASSRIRFQPRYYSFQLEKNTTISKYFSLARNSRYGHPMLLPYQMDFIHGQWRIPVGDAGPVPGGALALANEMPAVRDLGVEAETDPLFAEAGIPETFPG